MGSGGFPVDLILFGMVAAFLVLRLRSILGRRTGFERQATPLRPAEAPPIIEGRAEPVPVPPVSRRLPEPSSEAGRVLSRMVAIDGSFDPQRFLAGAEGAFRLIVTAFAAGDRNQLRPLLTDPVYAGFEGAITAREAASQTQTTEIKSVHEASIEAAALNEAASGAQTRGDITVRFVSDQITLTTAADGAPVAGTDAVTELVDLWTFERDLASGDPAWRLSAAHSG